MWHVVNIDILKRNCNITCKTYAIEAQNHCVVIPFIVDLKENHIQASLSL